MEHREINNQFVLYKALENMLHLDLYLGEFLKGKSIDGHYFEKNRRVI